MSRGVERSSRMPDRYEPLPGVAELPAWVWRRLPPAAKGALAVLLLVLIGLAIALAPGIERGKDERATAEAEQRLRQREQRVAELRVQQRPRFGRGVAAGSDLAARATLLSSAAARVEADARSRASAGELAGPIRRVACEPYPRSLSDSGAHTDPGRSRGTYACLAVTREVPPSERSEAALIGHPYRVRIDFTSGRYALCKLVGRAGEGSIATAPLVTVPPACGGR
jgi:hypothetical protein